ncbi:MAG: trypsin-like peptidase domain-containing protein [Ketobacter sp.]|uniref:trypsin-like peptidase domain-containing protein n=1 Tax=Ketobacter sp. MCCC 1A13808 TaxID=2602738 RepID=UPI0018DD969F|nr:trypsin-like peptidase domain-containing protein [Ketobacter sp. MCCC 1A13808]
MISVFRSLALPVLFGLVIALGYIVLADGNPTRIRHEVVMLEKQVMPEQQQSTVTISDPISYADAVSKTQPAVVNISADKLVTERAHPLYEDPVFRRFFGMHQPKLRQRMLKSRGSGVIISPSGYILTNNHVIAQADTVRVALADGRNTVATVVGTDPETDLALLYVELPDLPTITLANTDNLRVGDVVLAMGNPFNVGQTVTKGIVSAIGRHQSDLATFVDFIQTDAAINPGNSGGALVNAYGDLVGINTAMLSGSGGSQGIGFAIPITTAKEVVKQLLEHGQVIRGWVGIEPQALNTALSTALDLPNVNGLLVMGVVRDGPAHRSGISPGDIITHMNGNPISDPKFAMDMITDMSPGAKVTIRVIRKNQPLDILVVVGARPTPNAS